MLAGVIFDLDGTLGETLPVCFEAFRTVLRRFNGEEHTDAAIRAMFGPTEEGILLRRVPHAGHAAVDAYLEAYRNLHSRVPEPFDGIRDLLATLDDRNVRMAVVTGKGAGSAAISLDVWGLGATTATSRIATWPASSPTGVWKPPMSSR
jgi:pyrophosphatase PpaX